MRVLLLIGLTGCVLNSNKWKRPRDLEDSWLITKPRLLGIQARPPEARPGETIEFSALMPDPNGEIDTRLWLACPVEEGDGGIGFGCISGDDAIIGVEPFQAPAYQVPADFLADLPEEERLEGRYVNVQVTGLPPIDPTELEEGFDFEDIDFNTVEAGYKRVIVSEAITPNQNPVIERMAIEGTDILPGQVVEFERDTSYDVQMFFDDSSIETYVFVNRDGVEEERVEEPYVAWYTTHGEMVEPYTLYPFTQAQWHAPPEPVESGTIWGVVRDRRGGQTWTSFTFTVR